MLPKAERASEIEQFVRMYCRIHLSNPNVEPVTLSDLDRLQDTLFSQAKKRSHLDAEMLCRLIARIQSYPFPIIIHVSNPLPRSLL